MQIRFLLVVSLLFSINVSAESWKDYSLVNGCRIYSMAGFMIRSFPGSICIFLDNGNIISASDNALRMINPKNEFLWEQKGHFHHQVNLSFDKKRILALSSDIQDGLREDTFQIFDLNGKELAHQKASELYKLAGEKPLKWSIPPLTLNGISTTQEYSHFNSIYEIPKLSGTNHPSWMKEGNIILNTTESGIFILSPDMSTLLHHLKLKGSTHHRVHDVQVKSNGNFLLFNNLVAVGPPTIFYLTAPTQIHHHSAIQEIHPVTEKVVQEFTTTPKTAFYSWICGSIQELDSDTWLMTHFLSGTFIYSKSKKDFIVSIPGTHADNQRFAPVQQVKAQDLSLFMSHWP